MSDRVLVNADMEFVEGVIKAGGGDLNKCYQCSTCTVVCPLTPEGAPFPRKEMINAQWGIKEKLLTSMDPWLCFHCNDCQDQCPRGAKPGDVMAAIRNMIITNIGVPSIFAKASATVGGAIGLLLIPMAIIAAFLLGIHGTEFAFLDDPGPMKFSKMFTVMQIDSMFVPAGLFLVITTFLGIKKLIAGLQKEYPKGAGGESLGEALIGTVKDILSHKQFKECGINRSRNVAHLLLMYGFVGLFFTTALVVGIHYSNIFGLLDYDTPLPFFHPVKILGNVSALSATIGILMIAYRRLVSPLVGTSVAFDWIFISDVLLIMATGILAQVTREAGMNPLAYVIYYFHLVFVFYLFIYASNSKFGHMFYRTAALVYARYSGRSKSVGVNLLETADQGSEKAA